jgi:hypothetical protein
MVLNRDKLAEVLGCSLRTIDEYVRQGMAGSLFYEPFLVLRRARPLHDVCAWTRAPEEDIRGAQ